MRAAHGMRALRLGPILPYAERSAMQRSIHPARSSDLVGVRVRVWVRVGKGVGEGVGGWVRGVGEGEAAPIQSGEEPDLLDKVS